MKLKPNTIIATCFFLLSASILHAQDSSFTNSIGMEFKFIQPGNFIMGRFQPPYPKPPSDTVKANATTGAERGYNTEEYKLAAELAKKDALPGFTATIKKPFYIGKFEV